MQRTSCSCPAQNKATRAVLIFRILLDDFPIEQSFHNLLIPNRSLDAALNGMLSPIVYPSSDLFYNRLDIHPGLITPLPTFAIMPYSRR